MCFQLVIYDAGSGNKEGEEHKKLLAFYPETYSLDDQLAIAGLLQGLQIFSATLCDKPQEKDDFCFIETDKSCWALLEPESDIVLGLLAVRNWLPRHATRANMRNLLIYLYCLVRCTCGRLKSALLEHDRVDAFKSHLSGILGMIGFQLSNHSSKLSREFRNPFTILGCIGTIRLPVDITTEIHAFAGQALIVLSRRLSNYFTSRIIICCGQYVLWSTVSREDTAAINAFLWTDILPTGFQVESDRTSFLGKQYGHFEKNEHGFIVTEKLHSTGSVSLPPLALSCEQSHVLFYCHLDMVIGFPLHTGTISASVLHAIHEDLRADVEYLGKILNSQLLSNNGSLHHLSGSRFLAHDSFGSCTVPRRKVSAMSHHARELGSSMIDAMFWSQDVELACSTNAHAAWGASVPSDFEWRPNVVVNEQKLGNTSSSSIDVIAADLRHLSM